jgi:hypothetical protein
MFEAGRGGAIVTTGISVYSAADASSTVVH